MIGVISDSSEASAVLEFFQLFKIPWQWYVAGNSYSCIVSGTGALPDDFSSELAIVYQSGSAPLDKQLELGPKERGGDAWVSDGKSEFPIYGKSLAFVNTNVALLRFRDSNESAACEKTIGGKKIVRIGYDLFQEVAWLLSTGQPAKNANIPTLDLHIALLRSILVGSGVRFAEILPFPSEHEFMCCLTHDVDFTGISEHKCDLTMCGFLYRATLKSLIDAVRGKRSWERCRTNWRAALSLPLVYFGVVPDFWLEFDRYRELERDLGSTFFFIPFKNCPGQQGKEPAPARRAAKYDVLKMKEDILRLANDGCEIGLHGIDAWCNSHMARRECAVISNLTGQAEVGVRMHWLYFRSDSPDVLESAQLSYDSTFGYNDAVGFRAGTSQVFCIPPSKSLLELPLIVQDTALFYPDRMNLRDEDAMNTCIEVIEQFSRFGGVLTVNWHTRSLSPERLWGEFYKSFIARIKSSRAWFGTAQQIVNWFRARRAIEFLEVCSSGDTSNLIITGPSSNGKPPFRVRVYNASKDINGSGITEPYYEIPWPGGFDLALAMNQPAKV
jgi:hypothetical protein